MSLIVSLSWECLGQSGNNKNIPMVWDFANIWKPGWSPGQTWFQVGASFQLVHTCDDLCSLWSRSNLHASQQTFFTIGPPNTSQCKFCLLHTYFEYWVVVPVGDSHYYSGFFTTVCLLSERACPFCPSTLKSVSKFIFQNLWLHVLATPVFFFSCSPL